MGKNMARKISKWLRFSKIGQPIANTFITFKVPLKESLNHNLAQQERFYVRDLLRQVPNLGLVVDLTQTTKYYDPRSITDEGIEYHKIFVAGHGQIPPRTQVTQFFSIVEAFRRKVQEGNLSRSLIGVHCTHGCNRTGYLVCKYLIEKMRMEPAAALHLFASTRGHFIERDAYKMDILATRIGEVKVKEAKIMKKKAPNNPDPAAVKVHSSHPRTEPTHGRNREPIRSTDMKDEKRKDLVIHERSHHPRYVRSSSSNSTYAVHSLSEARKKTTLNNDSLLLTASAGIGPLLNNQTKTEACSGIKDIAGN